MLSKISVVIITKNVADILPDALQSAAEFAEVLVYDNGSDDTTLELAATYANVKTVVGEFAGFGKTKQAAVNAASNDWILSLDADEVISAELVDELRHFSASDNTNFVGKVLRENYFLGKHVRYSGWGKDWLIRFFNRTQHNFNDAMVHEKIEVKQTSQLKKIQGVIRHAAVRDVSQFLVKVNRYSTIRAETIKRKKSPVVVLLKAQFAFFRTYILYRGFLDGAAGLVIAFSDANGVFWKYMKRYYRDK